MLISINEIRDRAHAFALEWKDVHSESAEAKSFWDNFFDVFGVSRKRVASFEEPVKKSDGSGGFIDLLWKGKLLVEHKSKGKSLDRAAKQATDYFSGLKDVDLPRFVVVSDFANFRLYDLESNTREDFKLGELHSKISLFGFISGYQSKPPVPEDPINIKAVAKLGTLHDELGNTGYTGHALEVLMVRLLFCLFSEDTGIFNEIQQFQDYIEQRTSEDGADLGMHLSQLFQVLNTEISKRQKNLDEQEAGFPYVNGKLFEEILPTASFTRKMRESLLDCCYLDWSRISPAIFGSLFQSVMSRELRRNLGGHYTTEANILKALGPLLLDDLWAEFETVRTSPKRLHEFHDKLAGIRVFDPACGCGNFLVVAYRELRRIDLEVLRAIQGPKKHAQLKLDSKEFAVTVDVDQFYGIELEEFPAQIAQVALWLTDHQMNQQVSQEFGEYYVRIPLVKTPHIVQANALDLDWATVIPPKKLTCIVGNPPFAGAKYMSERQVEERNRVFDGVKNAGLLDYVSNWYIKAARYMAKNPVIRAALVSTNSITQGEQVGVLWGALMALGIKIQFAHRTFQWTSEAQGKAAVHCVIIGFGLNDVKKKLLFDYDTPKGTPHEFPAKNINPYLVDAPFILVNNRTTPLVESPPIGIGNKPIDGGNYLFGKKERKAFIKIEPRSKAYFHRWMGAEEFLNGKERWCLWLGDCAPNELKSMPKVMERVKAVRAYRLSSRSAGTRRLAQTPTRFHVENFPPGPYLLIPGVSSERRPYVPIGFMPKNVITSNLCLIVTGADHYHMGVLSSAMHMAWMRAVAGRLESRYRYSAGIVYNNFPWPLPTGPKKLAIVEAAKDVLEARKKFSVSTLADLYDPLTMPVQLQKAHKKLDKAVDVAYGRRKISGESDRLALLFERYQKLTA